MTQLQSIEGLAIWRADPIQFVRDNFKIEPDEWQKEVLTEFARSNRIGMKASKGCGKTAILSWCAWNFIATRPFPKMAATSISSDNLSDGLWAEMSKWQSRSPFLRDAFQWNKTRISAKEFPETWFFSARSWSKSADQRQQADTLAGLHAEYLLFILDEVGGIPDSVMAAAEAGLSTGTETKLLMAGNPTHLEGPLYRACTSEKQLWKMIEITGDPDDPRRAKRISEQWAREQIEKYGRDNPWVLVNVFGKFPPSSMNTLIGPDEVQEGMRRKFGEDRYIFAQKRLGVDVARFGDDSTVIAPRQGLRAFNMKELKNLDSFQVGGHVLASKAKWQSEMEFIDGTGGYGAGVIDYMRNNGHVANEVIFSGKSLEPKRYFNKRAEIWFKMIEWIKAGGALPHDDQLAKELCAPTYWFAPNGTLQLESKDQIKSRLGYSPDKADALALTFALPDMPSMLMSGDSNSRGKTKCEWDPFAIMNEKRGNGNDYDPFSGDAI